MKSMKDVNKIMKIDSEARLNAIAEACRTIIEALDDTCHESSDFYAGMLQAAETKIKSIKAAASL